MTNYNTIYRGFMIQTINTNKGIILNVFQIKDGNQLYRDSEGFASVQNAVDVAKAGIDRVLSRSHRTDERLNNL